jgi:ferric-dicitrate binding protein FerR (iron transport regulator)
MHPLIIKYIDKTITPQEKAELQDLVRTDQGMKEEFISAQNVYALSAFIPSENDNKEGLAKLNKFKKKQNKTKYVSLLKSTLGYVAVICLAVIMTTLYLKTQENDPQELVAYEEFTTPSGQRALLKLHDGTSVWLNASSTLRYPNVFNGKIRKVELDGEAFFEVKHNEERPFIVSTEKIDIRVLGTSFNVYAYKKDNSFLTFLEKGSIKIYNTSDENNALFLNPNEIAELKNNKLTKKSVLNKDFLLWKEGIYAFDDIPFKEIVRRLELYYDIKITLDNDKLAEYRFSGKFRQRDGIVSALRTFQKVYYFRFNKDDELNHITIK